MLNISKDEKRYSEIELDLHKKLAYEKGRASIVDELEKIKEKIEEKKEQNFIKYGEHFINEKQILKILDNHIKELKKESKDCVDCGNNCDNGCCKKGCIGYCEGRYWKPKGENNA